MAGYRNVIEGRNPRNVCTQAQIFKIRQRCAFLCMAYIRAREKMNAVTWQECCRSACEHLNVTGIEQTIGWQIVK